MAAQYRLYLHAPDGRRLGEFAEYSGASFALRFNAVGSWSVTVPQDNPLARRALDGWGYRLVVTRDGAPLLSGRLRRRRRTSYIRADHLILAGPDDLWLLAARRALPVTDGRPFSAASHDVFTGPCETVLHHYVFVNAGPGATLERRWPGLVHGPDLGRGATITGRARFDPLLDFLAARALEGGGLGFRVVRTAAGLRFETYRPADRTREAVFSRGRGNLGDYDYEEEAPEANYPYALGGGELTARTVVHRGDSASIVAYDERIETVVDARDTSDAGELDQRIDRELAERGPRTNLRAMPIDTKGLSFGDYGLGDRVTVEIDGVPVREVIREVGFALGEGGRTETITPLVGPPGAIDPDTPRFFGRLARAERRVGHMETQR